MGDYKHSDEFFTDMGDLLPHQKLGQDAVARHEAHVESIRAKVAALKAAGEKLAACRSDLLVGFADTFDETCEFGEATLDIRARALPDDPAKDAYENGVAAILSIAVYPTGRVIPDGWSGDESEVHCRPAAWKAGVLEELLVFGAFTDEIDRSEAAHAIETFRK